MSTADAFEALAEAAGVAGVGAEAGLALGEGPLGRGLFCTRSAGLFGRDVLLRVPATAALTVAVEPSTSGVAKAHAREVLAAAVPSAPAALLALLEEGGLSAEHRLAALVAWAVGAGGSPGAGPVWRAYAALLPTHAELGTQLTLSAEALDALQDDGLVRAARAARAAARQAFEHFVAPALGPHVPSLQEYALALTHVQSRTFSGWVDGGGELGIVVPFACMANHSFDPNGNFQYRADAGTFELFARRGVSAGDEFCISYGEGHENAKLVAAYGFSVPGNPNEPLANVGPEPFGVAPDALRKHVADLASQGELPGRLRAASNALTTGQPVAHAAAAARDRVHAALASFPTSASEDLALLANPELTAHMQTAVGYRLERKRVLMTAARLAEAAVANAS